MEQKQVITTDKAPRALGPYSQGIKTENLIFVSGQLGINPANGELIGEDIASQTKQALTNIESILKQAGISLEQALKTTVYLKNIEDFKVMNDIYASFFSNKPPVRSTIEASNLPKNALCEIDCIAGVTK